MKRRATVSQEMSEIIESYSLPARNISCEDLLGIPVGASFGVQDEGEGFSLIMYESVECEAPPASFTTATVFMKDDGRRRKVMYDVFTDNLELAKIIRKLSCEEMEAIPYNPKELADM